MRIDLHNHSEYSHDCENTLKDIKTRAIAKGLTFMAITDHDIFKLRDSYFIKGCEFSLQEGHLIALFLKREIKTREVNELIKSIKSQDGIIIIPHPLKKGSGFSEENIIKYANSIDAIEVFNPDNSFYGNWTAYRLAKKLNKCMVSGSDAHTLEAIGTGSSEILNKVRNKEHLKELIKNNELRIVLDQKYNPQHSMSLKYLTLLYAEMLIRKSGLYQFKLVQCNIKRINYLLRKYVLKQAYR